MNKKDCCYECGKKRYGTSGLKSGITIQEGICPFCKEKKMLIPAEDWEGRGD